MITKPKQSDVAELDEDLDEEGDEAEYFEEEPLFDPEEAGR